MDRQSLIKINKLALQYFVENLQKNKNVYSYLRSRLSDQCIKNFHIGYAPQRGLVGFLKRQKVGMADAGILGLIGTNEDGSFFDVFSNRIMIPIVHAGMLVGFGARRFGDDNAKAKYINSKASVLYKKNEILFGLWYSREYVRECNFAIVLEGYFDWLSLFESGIFNVVAVCGTALTPMHCTTLKRYTNNVGIMFDGDAIGISKAKKTREILREEGMKSFLLTLPKDLDPDEYLKMVGISKMRNWINECRKENNNDK